MTDNNTKDVPEWAAKEICRRTGESFERYKAGTLSSGCSHIIRIAAEILAEHEEPPVDPLDEAIGDAFDRLPDAWDRSIFVKQVGVVLRRHGVTMGASNGN